MLPERRLMLGAAARTAGVTLVAALIICAACDRGPMNSAWAHYQDKTLAFDHPESWKQVRQQFYSGSFYGPIAVLSTRKPDHDLCYRKSISNGIQEGCDRQRLGKLASGDVILIVGAGGTPFGNPLWAGEPLTIDGHQATLSRTDSGCANANGGDSWFTLTILQQDGHNFVSLDACSLKVPDLEQTMRRLAASTRLAPFGT